MNLFELRGSLDKKTQVTLGILGGLGLLAMWYLITALGLIQPSILPSPGSILACLPELHFKDAMVRHLLRSIYLNGAGYLEAVAVSVPLGYLIGLFPIFNGLFNKPVDAVRFIPLTAVTGLFIAWFGITDLMKVQFLAFGIIVYLLPVVVQRVDQVEKVYQQTAYTLGATRWQTIRTVFFPAVLSKLFDDIRVLVAISWTYIIVAETLNNSGGIGVMLYQSARQGQVNKTFALLFVIILVGFFQDLALRYMDRKIFPHKQA